MLGCCFLEVQTSSSKSCVNLSKARILVGGVVQGVGTVLVKKAARQ